MKTIRVAHVGAFKRKSQADQSRHVAAVAKIVEHDRNYFQDGIAEDIINLSYGRDFLREGKHYDVVIVHSVLSPKVRVPSKMCPRLQVSPDHTFKTWKKRLVSTGSKYISICEGQPVTMNGWELGDLPGYRILERDHLITLYQRKKA